MTVAGIIREQSHRYVPRRNWTLYAGDILVLQGDPTALQPLVDQAKLKLLGAEEIAALKPHDKDDELETVEAVIAPDSLLIGNTPQDLHLRQDLRGQPARAQSRRASAPRTDCATAASTPATSWCCKAGRGS